MATPCIRDTFLTSPDRIALLEVTMEGIRNSPKERNSPVCISLMKTPSIGAVSLLHRKTCGGDLAADVQGTAKNSPYGIRYCCISLAHAAVFSHLEA